MRFITIPILLSVSLATPALGQVMTESGGTQYDVTCNADGAVLTPQGGGDPVYFGRSCDAWADTLGAGTWGWANGGVRADFATSFLGFARQEVACPAEGPQPDLLACGL